MGFGSIKGSVGGAAYQVVDTYADLPVGVSGLICIVKTTTGIWGFRKLAGFYRYDASWNYLGVGDWVDLGTDQTIGGVKNFTGALTINGVAPVITTDTRLSDARTPTAHNQAWSSITGTPTTVTGYGLTDVYPKEAGDARYSPSGYGLGDIAPTTTADFNTLTGASGGFFWASGNNANSPDAHAGHLWISGTSTYVIQKYVLYDNSARWERTCNASTWSPWKQLATTDNPVFTGSVGIGTSSPRATLHSTGSTILGFNQPALALGSLGVNEGYFERSDTENRVYITVRKSNGTFMQGFIQLTPI